MPPSPQIPQIDRQRPECVALDNRIKQRRASLARFRAQLQQTQDLEEREEILRNINILSEEVEALLEELAFEGCYVFPTERGTFLKVVGVEATQSTQFLSIEGTGAGADNSIRFIAKKPMLARVYVRNEFPDSVPVNARLTIYDFNNNTLKYDILRKAFSPLNTINRAGSSASTRLNILDTLNFMIPASECVGRVRLDILAWVVGHEGDPIYEGEGVLSPVEFMATRQPIIQCFRIRFSIPNMNPALPPTVLAAPSFADCVQTMAFAQRMWPFADMSIVDRGTRDMSGPLTTQADYDAVRQQIQTLRDGTTPTPQDHDIYVGMLPDQGGLVWGNAAAGCIESVVNRPELFAHELGHLLLPGDDHVNDTACPLNPGITQLDNNYPDYANTAQASGIGEFGVDLGTSPLTLFRPDTPDIMSYCNNQWISPYNYNRAMIANVLNPSVAASPARADAQKLVVSFRVYRDGRVEFRQGMHLPGEARPVAVKASTRVFLELYGADDGLLASVECGRSPDLPETAPYEDFQAVLAWHDQAQSLAVVRERQEVARWQIEEPAAGRVVTNLSYRGEARETGEPVLRVSWRARPSERRRYMLRFTPDGGESWLAVAAGLQETRVDVDEGGLPAGGRCRFQVLASTGFRTTVEESEEFPLAPRQRQIVILEPRDGAELTYGGPIWLAGAAGSLLGEEGRTIDAFWSSNRDGFLGDGLSVFAQRLSPGRHALTLTVEDGSGGEANQRVVVWVRQESDRPTEAPGR